MSETAVADPTTTATTGADKGTATTTTTVQPYYADLLQSDGTFNAKSWERLPEHRQGLRPTLEKQKDMDSLLGALDHYQSLAGKKALAPLPPNATKEAVAERKALLDQLGGVPADVKDYGITRESIAKDLPEQAWNQPLADNFIAWAHRNSIPPAEVKRFLSEVQIPAVKGNLAAQQQNEAKFWTGEQQKFEALIARENIPGERAAALIEKAAVAMGLDLTNAQTKNFLRGSDARMILMRHAIATGESPTITSGGGGGGSGGTDYSAQALDIQRNPANPEYAVYRNVDGKFSRQQVDAVKERVNELYRLAAEKAGKKDIRGARR